MRALRIRLIAASLLWSSGLLMLTHVAFVWVHNARWMFPYSIWIGISIGLALAIPGFLVGRSCLTPFRQLRQRLNQVRAGTSPQVDGDYPVEVQPLVDDLNALLEQRETAIRKAHAAAGDLAHGLKTPLAILAQEAARADGDLAASLHAQVDRMTRLVNYQLARARSAASGSAAPCPVEPVVESLIRTLHKLHGQRGLRIRYTLPSAHAVRVRREDLEEILGNLMDNACKWAKSEVRVEARARALAVDDDGAGLDESQFESVLRRGVRLDEATPGSGLGLAIVRDLVETYGGSLTLARSPLGGLRAKVEFPKGDRIDETHP